MDLIPTGKSPWCDAQVHFWDGGNNLKVNVPMMLTPFLVDGTAHNSFIVVGGISRSYQERFTWRIPIRTYFSSRYQSFIFHRVGISKLTQAFADFLALLAGQRSLQLISKLPLPLVIRRAGFCGISINWARWFYIIWSFADTRIARRCRRICIPHPQVSYRPNTRTCVVSDFFLFVASTPLPETVLAKSLVKLRIVNWISMKNFWSKSSFSQVFITTWLVVWSRAANGGREENIWPSSTFASMYPTWSKDDMPVSRYSEVVPLEILQRSVYIFSPTHKCYTTITASRWADLVRVNVAQEPMNTLHHFDCGLVAHHNSGMSYRKFKIKRTYISLPNQGNASTRSFMLIVPGLPEDLPCICMRQS